MKDIATVVASLFYDFVVFVIPGGALLLGGLPLLGSVSDEAAALTRAAYAAAQGSAGVAIAVFGFCAAYTTGILIQSAAHSVVFGITARLAVWLRRRHYFYSDVRAGTVEALSIEEKRHRSHRLWIYDQARLDRQHGEIGKGADREFVRLDLSRSIALVALVLSVVALLAGDKFYAAMALTFAVGAFWDVLVRREWVNLEVHTCARALADEDKPAAAAAKEAPSAPSESPPDDTEK